MVPHWQQRSAPSLPLPPCRPDVIHCHDWPTAPVTFGDTGRARSVFTIHNLNFGADLIGRAMGASAVGTTVSPTYAVEISGHPAVAPNMSKFYGIINGIDMDIWDPQSDEFMPMYVAKFCSDACNQCRVRSSSSMHRSAACHAVGVSFRVCQQFQGAGVLYLGSCWSLTRGSGVRCAHLGTAQAEGEPTACWSLVSPLCCLLLRPMWRETRPSWAQAAPGAGKPKARREPLAGLPATKGEALVFQLHSSLTYEVLQLQNPYSGCCSLNAVQVRACSR